MMEILDAKISNKINLVWYSDDIKIIQHLMIGRLWAILILETNLVFKSLQ